jgi:endogenous inhibitor of DNA gyrase (YacG/DUF329 family)
MKKGILKLCTVCGKEYYVMQCHKESKFCSIKCHSESMKNRLQLQCKICGKKYERPVSQVKWRGSNYCSKECQDIGATFKTGEKSVNWKGGISYNNNRIRKAIEWKNWRNGVFKRDNYTCQICGIKNKKGIVVELHPHHIKSFSLHHELRYDVNNGQTLCSICHHKLHGNLSKGEKRLTTNLRFEKICEGCFKNYYGLKNQKYCSHACNERKRRRDAKACKELSPVL